MYPLLLALWIAPLSSHCTYTQAYWLASNSSEWPTNSLLCNVSWPSLLQIETIKMSLAANQLWVAASHQMITTALNMAHLNTTNEAVAGALLVLNDSLERFCNNVSQWPLDSSIYTQLALLRRFNQGDLAYGPGPCDENMTTTNGDAFYYVSTPDLIVLPLAAIQGGNATGIASYSLLTDVYRFRQFTLSSAIIGCLIVCPFLLVCIAVICNKRRKFFGRKAKKKVAKTIAPDNVIRI